MRLPDNVREQVYERVSVAAENRNWMSLAAPDKSHLYSVWAQDPQIGGVLLGFMSMNEVHRYIKDTTIKTYATNKISEPTTALNLLGVPLDLPRTQQYEKPPGVMLEDRRIIAWSVARDWKTTVFAVYERSYSLRNATPYAVVLFGAEGKFADERFQSMVRDASTRLGIERVVWNPA
jgi:hypothetical protein